MCYILTKKNRHVSNQCWLIYARSVGKHRVKRLTFLRGRFCVTYFQNGAKKITRKSLTFSKTLVLNSYVWGLLETTSVGCVLTDQKTRQWDKVRSWAISSIWIDLTAVDNVETPSFLPLWHTPCCFTSSLVLLVVVVFRTKTIARNARLCIGNLVSWSISVALGCLKKFLSVGQISSDPICGGPLTSSHPLWIPSNNGSEHRLVLFRRYCEGLEIPSGLHWQKVSGFLHFGFLLG